MKDSQLILAYEQVVLFGVAFNVVLGLWAVWNTAKDKISAFVGICFLIGGSVLGWYLW